MAAPIKRSLDLEIGEDESVPAKRSDFSNDEKLKVFMEWCKQKNFNISSKVTVSRKGSCAQYGMVALDDIAQGYALFQVPRDCLLMPENLDIADLIQKDTDKLSATNQWIPLLVSLIHEQNKASSKWRPYLDLVPDYTALDLPIFWNKDDIEKFLRNSGVDLVVIRDKKMMKEDFETLVLPFFQRYSQKIGDDVKDFDQFMRQVAFVMAYSFTEPKCQMSSDGDSLNHDSDTEDDGCCNEMSPPMMVPMADMLNHVTNHNAKLTFGKEALKMVTTRKIRKGEEIFNTYGQVSNLHLMHMYGFAEPYPDNINDVIEIPASLMLDAAIDIGGPDDSEFLKKKWKYLMDEDTLSEDEIFVVGKEGIISDEICMETLKVLCKSKSDFEEYKLNAGWSDGESDSSLSGNSKLSLDKVPGLDKKWKQLLKRTTELHMSKYPNTLCQDKERLKSSTSMESREKYSTYLVHSQKIILQSLIDACG